MAKVLDSNPEVREFKLRRRYYIHFCILGKSVNPLIVPAVG